MELQELKSYHRHICNKCTSLNRYLRIDVQPDTILMIYCPVIIPTARLDILPIKSSDVYEIRRHTCRGGNIKIHVERKRDVCIKLDVRYINVHSCLYAEEAVNNLAKIGGYLYDN